VDHVERRVQPNFPEADDDLAVAGHDVDGCDHAVESLCRDVQLMASRRDVLGHDRGGADEPPIDEHLRACYIAVDVQCPDLWRRLDDRRRRFDDRGGGNRRRGESFGCWSDRFRVRGARCWSGRRRSGGRHRGRFGLWRVHPGDDDRRDCGEPRRGENDDGNLTIHEIILTQQAFVDRQV
jgi:hypothetical protein